MAAKPHFTRGDVWGGLAAMLVALPSSIAFGVVIFSAASPSLSSAGALAGIVGAAILGIVAPLIGRNGGFITAPCAPAAAVLSGVAGAMSAAGAVTPARVVILFALIAAISALLQIAFGALRFGKVIKYIPYQVVTGYLSGVAVIIAVAQLPRLLGMPSARLDEALVSPRRWNGVAIAVGIVTIAAMMLARRITQSLPAAVLGVGAGMTAYFAMSAFLPPLRATAGNPLVIGPIPSAAAFLAGLSSRAAGLTGLGMADLLLVIGPAATLSILLSIDTLKTGVVLDSMMRTRHDSNRELIAQGVANAASCLAGGIPGAGTMGPTLVNVTSGGRTLWSGVISGALIAIAFVSLGPLIAWVPIAALAGVLIAVAWRMFDFGIFRLLRSPSTRLDFVVIASVIVVVEAVGLIQAALLGVCLAILLFIRDHIRASVVARRTDLREMRSSRRRTSEELQLLDQHGSDALCVSLRGDLFFGTADQLFHDLERDLAERRYLLLDFRRVDSMDYTAMHLLVQMQERLRERGGDLLFSGMPSSLPTHREVREYLAEIGATAGDPNVFATRDSALEWMEEQVLARAGWIPATSRPPLGASELAICRGLERVAVSMLHASLAERACRAAEVIFDVGDGGDEIFFVRSGRVHILLPLDGGQRHHLATICRGEFFGEMAFLDRAPRSAQALAATETQMFSLSRAAFEQLAARDRALAAAVFERLARGIAQRLRVADAELRALEER